MTEREIYDGVIMNGTTDFAFVVETLRRHGARWCAIGGLAVNTYVEPVYTVDLNLVVIGDDLPPSSPTCAPRISRSRSSLSPSTPSAAATDSTDRPPAA